MSVRWIRSGITREVFLVGRYAIKIPSLRTWRHFINGILCNLNERDWWYATESPLLSPVHYCMPTGLLLIMSRAKALTPAGEYAPNYGILDRDRIEHFLSQWEGYPVEAKPDSFGQLDGRIVAVDYGDGMLGDDEGAKEE